jgi:catechol 2,3-dioxygenase-like lactoylglutathione lyase family enzyme
VRARLDEIVVDCHEPARLVRFWAAVLGAEPVDREPNWSYIDPPGTPRIAFQAVPEPKSGKNRLHLDIAVEDVDAAAEEAVALGASRSGGIVRDEHGPFQVMLDPEENEFCFIA